MKLKKVRVKNFRLIEEIEVSLEPHTAILGGNGCGKSTLLRAIEKFYGQQNSLDADDFFNRDLLRTVEIELTFYDFNAVERELFSSRIHGGEMSVVRVFEAGGGKSSGAYFGSTLKNPEFEEIRATTGAVEKRNLFNALRANPKYAEMPGATRADQVDEAMTAWELAHPEECRIGRDDGRFFGFTNVAKGALQRATNFVFVPAVRDASLDSMDAKGSVIARLMELVVRSAIQNRSDIREFQSRISEEYKQITDPEKLPELGKLEEKLSETLKTFYGDAAVGLQWRPTQDFEIPLPAADVFLEDDGFRGPVDRKGHGLQRAFVVTLLQHLVQASSQGGKVEEVEGKSDASEPPGLILAIEEPELYQHPTKQRHFHRVLRDLSSGKIPGVAGNTQVLFASHSPLFVSMDSFDEIRISRRVACSDGASKTCAVKAASLPRVARRLELANGVKEGTFTDDSLKARLHILGAELAEGFFAELVVLVEGVSDKAALYAAAKKAGINFEALGIAVLVADGKSKIDRPAVVFQEFGIPTYTIWDSDSSKEGADRVEAAKINRCLQALNGVEEGHRTDFGRTISETWASFDDTLESTLKAEIGADILRKHLDGAKQKFGIAKDKDALKTPAVLEEVLRGAESDGASSQSLELIVKAIVDLRQKVRED